MDSCAGCNGTGIIDVGDCDEGIVEACLECDGTGSVEEGYEFCPARDAFTPND